jgi:hypothetical protein
MFLHNWLNVLVQIANTMGLQNKIAKYFNGKHVSTAAATDVVFFMQPLLAVVW